MSCTSAVRKVSMQPFQYGVGSEDRPFSSIPWPVLHKRATGCNGTSLSCTPWKIVRNTYKTI